MIELSKDNFKEEVLEAKGYILVDFWSESCEPCKAFMPSMMELEDQYKGKLKFCKLDTTKARRLAISEKILGLPTVALYKDGVKLEVRTKDEVSKESIEEIIKGVIS
ncbi:thioredoxin TrxA [Alkaliphilus serpentinus]|uniref:Thioredoxin n=1 Tax=Alkaliphilus serpentinus TaxID=1482731 RepID=A0A833M7A0_9FIRM|nr:thioredoxin domain-containing protein [Alkaliphilus serpentinus]KAB3529997.1 thioredoxin [Alkaliphilus serpentinus]